MATMAMLRLGRTVTTQVNLLDPSLNPAEASIRRVGTCHLMVLISPCVLDDADMKQFSHLTRLRLLYSLHRNSACAIKAQNDSAIPRSRRIINTFFCVKQLASPSGELVADLPDADRRRTCPSLHKTRERSPTGLPQSTCDRALRCTRRRVP